MWRILNAIATALWIAMIAAVILVLIWPKAQEYRSAKEDEVDEWIDRGATDPIDEPARMSER